MIHTFRQHDGKYQVGLWMPATNDWSEHFVMVLTVDTLQSAIRLVNVLNGGVGNVDTAMARLDLFNGKATHDKHPRSKEGPAAASDAAGA